MAEQEVIDYVLNAQKHGLSDFEIKQNLINAGWEGQKVEENFVLAKSAESKSLNNLGGGQIQPKPTNLSPIAQGLQSKPLAASKEQASKSPPTHAPAITINEQSFSPKHSIFKNVSLWLTVVVLLIAAGGAYGYYTYIYVSPQKVWSNFMLNAGKAETQKIDYTFSYKDSGSEKNFSFSGKGPLDPTDINSPKISQEITVNTGEAGVEPLKFNFKFLNNILYLQLGQIEELKQALGEQNIDWVKIDPLGSYNVEPSAENAELNAKLSAIWSREPLVTPDDFLQKEVVDGKNMYHLKALFNTPAITSAVLDSIDLLDMASSTTSSEFNEETRKVLTPLIKKFTAKEFDLWVGQEDYRLYKFHLALSAPSENDIVSSENFDVGPLAQAQRSSRDAKRLSDIRTLQAALELYYSDMGGYPADDKNGSAKDLLGAEYLEEFPQAPVPADGDCTDYYNTYWYVAEGKAKTVSGVEIYPSYSLSFCLGKDTGSFAAGIGRLTPSGIASNVDCSGSAEQCVAEHRDQYEVMIEEINRMSFAGTITIDFSYSGYGEAVDIEAPENAVDLMQLIGGGIYPPGSSTDIDILTPY